MTNVQETKSFNFQLHFILFGIKILFLYFQTYNMKTSKQIFLNM